MRIGKLVRASGVNAETIRYYEREGLLPAPQRAANNYRVYHDGHRRRLCFIRRARELGFTLEEVRRLLSMIDGEDYTCAEVKGIGERHLQAVRQRIADLRRMERALDALVAECSGERSPDCSMLERLFED